jgi:hypothetical protein
VEAAKQEKESKLEEEEHFSPTVAEMKHFRDAHLAEPFQQFWAGIEFQGSREKRENILKQLCTFMDAHNRAEVDGAAAPLLCYLPSSPPVLTVGIENSV